MILGLSLFALRLTSIIITNYYYQNDILLNEDINSGLPTDIVPTHYEIQLIPQIEEGYFEGLVKIDLNVRRATHEIVMHVSQLTINESETEIIIKKDKRRRALSPRFRSQHHNVRITQDFPYDHFERYQHTYVPAKQQMIIRLPQNLHEHFDVVLLLKFRGLIKETSAIIKTSYTNNEGNKTFVAATNFQLFNARKAFPCWDEPQIKATFKLSIKHYPNYTALSNMPSTRSEIDSIDGKLWTYFETTPIMSTNILGFVIADYNHISNRDGTTKMWGSTHLVQNTGYYLDVAERATRDLERFTNIITVTKIDHVAIPNYPGNASTPWGMIIYKESYLLGEWLHDKVIMIVHLLAHQWFENLVSPAKWDHLWLSKSMSNYLSYYISDKIYINWRIMELFVVKVQLSNLNIDSYCFKPDTDVCDPFFKNTFRTAALLPMVSHFLREDVFQNGLRKYLQTHKYSSATPDDLWKALQDALDESDVRHDDFNVKEVMDTWINQPAYPVVKIDRDYDTNEIKVTQHKRINFWNITETEENNAWWIPFNFMTTRNLDFSSTLATHWLNPHNKRITIKGVDRFDTIIVNKLLTGYYRVNYDDINWMRIAEFLISDDYHKIPPLNRAQIITDVSYMMETEGLDFNIFLEVISYLWHEIDPVPWYPALDTIESLASSYLPIPDAALIFKPYLFNLTYKLFDHIGLDDNYYDDDPLIIEVRSKLTKLACLYDIHPECCRKATAILLAYVEDPIANKISSEKNLLLCCGLMRANESIWAQFLHTKEIELTTEFLGCSENLDIIQIHLNLLEEYHNLVYLFEKMFNNLPLNTDATDFIINQYEEMDANLQKHSSIYATSLHKIILSHFKEEDISKIETSMTEQRRLFLNNEYLDDRRRKIRKLNENLSKVQTVLKEHSFFYERNFLNKTYKLIVDGIAYE